MRGPWALALPLRLPARASTWGAVSYQTGVGRHQFCLPARWSGALAVNAASGDVMGARGPTALASISSPLNKLPDLALVLHHPASFAIDQMRQHRTPRGAP